VAALEILVSTTAVAANIREGKTHQIVSAMQMGAKHGMRLLNDSLLELVRAGTVEPMEAYFKAVHKEDMRVKLESIGARLDLGAAATAEAPREASKQPQGSPKAEPSPRAPLPSRPPSSAGLPPAAGPGDTGAAAPARGWSDPFDAFKRNRS
jgi:hypothetical protein